MLNKQYSVFHSSYIYSVYVFIPFFNFPRLHLMSGHAQLTKTGQRMLSDIAKLQARHHLFMEALNTDLDFYDEQHTSGRLSQCVRILL